jgi:hypothetical protein
MVRDLQRRLKLYGAPTAIVHKVALTPTQVTKWQLPPAPVKRSDKRAAKFIESHGDISAVELDALDPEDLQGIVKDAIEAYIEPSRWQEAIDKSTDDRGKIVAAIGNVKVYLSDTLA